MPSHIITAEVIDFADLGIEAVRRIKVKNLPACVIFDSTGRSTIFPQKTCLDII